MPHNSLRNRSLVCARALLVMGMGSMMSMTMLSGCQPLLPVATTANQPKATEMLKQAKPLSPAVQAVIGDYVSQDYDKRLQGYDWVAVSIRADGAENGNAEQIAITVRARSDIKKPTCHFDGQATLMGQDNAHGIIFQSTVNDSRTFFQFKGDTLIIDSQNKYALNYFCSGGGSIVGNYQKLEGELELY